MRELALLPGSLQNEMPFKINRPTKTAVSDRPNTFVAVRSLVFVMTWTLHFDFCFSRERLERGWADAPAYGGASKYKKLMLNLYAGAIRRCDLTLLLGLSVDVRFGSKADMCSAKRYASAA
jgi:hypothetical protein